MNVVQFNPDDPIVANRIVARRVFLEDSSAWDGLTSVVIDPPGFTMATGHYKWNGEAMVPCDGVESAAIEEAQKAASMQSQKQALKAILQDQGGALLHLVLAMVEEFHVHVASPTKTVNQLKQAIKANVESKIDSIAE